MGTIPFVINFWSHQITFGQIFGDIKDHMNG
jgi:hypothetical protein